MEEITMPSGRRVLRDGEAIYQEERLDSAHMTRDLDRARWMVDLGPDGQTDMPPPSPVLLVEAHSGCFFARKGQDRLLVSRGDYIAYGLNGSLDAVPAERVREFAQLPVARHARPGEVLEVADKVSGRVRNARHVALQRAAGETVSPISIRQDDKGRAHLVSTLPDGREKTWKSFAWREAAEDHLRDDKKREALEVEHARATRQAVSMTDHVDALRRARRGVER